MHRQGVVGIEEEELSIMGECGSLFQMVFFLIDLESTQHEPEQKPLKVQCGHAQFLSIPLVPTCAKEKQIDQSSCLG